MHMCEIQLAQVRIIGALKRIIGEVYGNKRIEWVDMHVSIIYQGLPNSLWHIHVGKCSCSPEVKPEFTVLFCKVMEGMQMYSYCP